MILFHFIVPLEYVFMMYVYAIVIVYVCVCVCVYNHVCFFFEFFISLSLCRLSVLPHSVIKSPSLFISYASFVSPFGLKASIHFIHIVSSHYSI